ncbi:MAG: hypothetical protein ACOX01_02020 [Methanobrevibacter boviskoreani]|jgi:TM2 domain-containing membrane protein YozV|uniref:hypothetical protein n=1 Tax=Methanobrevibacter TaxID=2172 RepID=UPI0003348332|nr:MULTISPECIES: hypothetical protein [Methanobrevibacter]AGN16681.1 hypothetical protein Abm4_0790 [Methanobrevibacter sp. AbM4]MCI6775612.1 hypothetical protein [Methanobrevibacter boviskoreani]
MVSKVLAAVISFFLPGVGQIIQNESLNGLLIFILTIIIFGILYYLSASWIAELVWFIIGLVSAYDAYQLPAR